MSNAKAFAECLINAEHKLLGVKLKPFCLLHLIWLYNIESPLVITNKEVTLPDLEIAAVICSSRSSEEILDRLNVKRKIAKRISHYLWHRRNTKADLKSELSKFIDYHNDFVSLPAFYNNGNITDEKIPWLLQTLGLIIKNTGWQVEYALTVPVGVIFSLNIASIYIETGDTNVKSDRVTELEALFSKGVI